MSIKETIQRFRTAALQKGEFTRTAEPNAAAAATSEASVFDIVGFASIQSIVGPPAGPGKAPSFVFPDYKDGRIVAADIVRLEKGHTEELELSATEHFGKLIVSAKGSKIQKQFQ